jgi:hypothetical protein
MVLREENNMKTWGATEGAYGTQRQCLLEYIILLVKAGVLVGSATGGEVGMEAPTKLGANKRGCRTEVHASSVSADTGHT